MLYATYISNLIQTVHGFRLIQQVMPIPCVYFAKLTMLKSCEYFIWNPHVCNICIVIFCWNPHHAQFVSLGVIFIFRIFSRVSPQSYHKSPVLNLTSDLLFQYVNETISHSGLVKARWVWEIKSWKFNLTLSRPTLDKLCASISKQNVTWILQYK